MPLCMSLNGVKCNRKNKEGEEQVKIVEYENRERMREIERNWIKVIFLGGGNNNKIRFALSLSKKQRSRALPVKECWAAAGFSLVDQVLLILVTGPASCFDHCMSHLPRSLREPLSTLTRLVVPLHVCYYPPRLWCQPTNPTNPER